MTHVLMLMRMINVNHDGYYVSILYEKHTKNEHGKMVVEDE